MTMRMQPASIDRRMRPKPNTENVPIDVVQPGHVSTVADSDVSVIMDSVDVPGDNDVQYIPASGAGQVLDITKYATFELVLTNNCGLSFINPLPNGELSIFLLILKQGGGGGYVTTFPSNIIWSSGVAPTLTTTPGYKTVIQFFSINAGVQWYGTVLGEAYA